MKIAANLSLLGLLLLLLAVAGGCSTTDPDNLSQRPWNAPKTWETGLPSSILEGR